MQWSQKLYPELEAFVNSPAARNFRPRYTPSGRGAVEAESDGLHHPGLVEAPPEVGGPGHALLCVEAAMLEFFQLVCM